MKLRPAKTTMTFNLRPATALPDYYTRLGVPLMFTAAQLRRNYLALALANHPDKATASERRQHAACVFGKSNERCGVCRRTEEFKRITEAYSVLRDPALRKAYDAKLQFAGMLRPCSYCGGAGKSGGLRGKSSVCKKCKGCGRT